MAAPDVADLLRISGAQNLAVGANGTPPPAPMNGNMGTGGWTRSSNILKPTGSGWQTIRPTLGSGPRTGRGWAAIWQFSGAVPASGVLLLYLSTGGLNGYHLRVDPASGDVYLQSVVSDSGTWLAGIDMVPAAGSYFGLAVNADGVSGFYSTDGVTWTRILTSNDTSRTGQFAAGIESNMGTSLGIATFKHGAMVVAQPLPIYDDFNRSNVGPPPGPKWANGVVFAGLPGMQVVSNTLRPSASGWVETGTTQYVDRYDNPAISIDYSDRTGLTEFRLYFMQTLMPWGEPEGYEVRITSTSCEWYEVVGSTFNYREGVTVATSIVDGWSFFMTPTTVGVAARMGGAWSVVSELSATAHAGPFKGGFTVNGTTATAFDNVYFGPEPPALPPMYDYGVGTDSGPPPGGGKWGGNPIWSGEGGFVRSGNALKAQTNTWSLLVSATAAATSRKAGFLTRVAAKPASGGEFSVWLVTNTTTDSPTGYMVSIAGSTVALRRFTAGSDTWLTSAATLTLNAGEYFGLVVESDGTVRAVHSVDGVTYTSVVASNDWVGTPLTGPFYGVIETDSSGFSFDRIRYGMYPGSTPPPAQDVTATGFRTQPTFGTATVKATRTVTVSGLRVLPTYGTATALPGSATRSLTGFRVQPTYGTATALPGGVSRTLTGFRVQPTFGTPTTGGAITVNVTGFRAQPTFGTVTATTGTVATPSGFRIQPQYGTPTVATGPVTVPVSGSYIAAQFGAPQIPLTIPVPGFRVQPTFGAVTHDSVSFVDILGALIPLRFGSPRGLSPVDNPPIVPVYPRPTVPSGGARLELTDGYATALVVTARRGIVGDLVRVRVSLAASPVPGKAALDVFYGRTHVERFVGATNREILDDYRSRGSRVIALAMPSSAAERQLIETSAVALSRRAAYFGAR